MDKRVVSAAILIPIMLFLIISGGIIFKIGILFATAIALYEYNGAFKHGENRAMLPILIFGLLLNIVIIFTNKVEYILPSVYLISILSMGTAVINRKYSIASSAITIMGYIYTISFFSLLIFIRDFKDGGALIWLVFIISWFSDTAAYYSGRFFGKRKLCPEVSPKKTIEGSIGGIIGSILGVLIWGYFSKRLSMWLPLIAMGVLGSVVAQMGDLVASLIKRYVGIKDFGNLMPGHGGILDRFDSILFTAPIVYYYIVIFT